MGSSGNLKQSNRRCLQFLKLLPPGCLGCGRKSVLSSFSREATLKLSAEYDFLFDRLNKALELET
jgi:hypothetical protein